MVGADMIGRELQGRYHIQGILGRGGMGTVYRAVQLSTGQLVAVKVLHSELMSHQDNLYRFRMEAQAITRLRHPNAVRLIDLGELDDGRLYLVTELLAGRTLDRLLEKDWPTSRLLIIVGQVAEALAEAHQVGIAHRDLKPSNIMVETFGRREVAKVLDFGIAKLGDQPKLTITGAIFGTPAYMSPEQARGESVGPPADVYSLGVILYQVMTGRLPFEAPSAGALLVKHITEVPPELSSLRSEIDPKLSELVDAMLQKQPEDRPESLLEVASILEKSAIESFGGVSVPPIPTELSLPPPAEYTIPSQVLQPPLHASSEPISFQKLMTWLIIVLVIAAAGALGVWLAPKQPVVEPLATAPSPSLSPTRSATISPHRSLDAPSPREDTSPPKEPTGARSTTNTASSGATRSSTIGPPSKKGTRSSRPVTPPPRPTRVPMVYVPPGEVILGCTPTAKSPCSAHDVQPARREFVDAFYIDKAEVTVRAYRECVQAQKCPPPKIGPLYNWGKKDRNLHPINGVTWRDAVTFCRWRGARLPTEAEWEKAARGKDRRTYPWGDTPLGRIPRANVNHEEGAASLDGFPNTAPVGSFPRGASPFGALDMAGNVWEWTASRFTPEKSNARVARGGSWYSNSASARVTTRLKGDVERVAPDVGFRCARSP